MQGTEEEKAAAGEVLVAVLEACRCIAVALSPVCPGLAARIYQQLGLGEGALGGAAWADAGWGQLQAGHATAAPAPVFVRFEAKTHPLVTEAAAAAQPKKGGGGKGKQAKQKQAPAAPVGAA